METRDSKLRPLLLAKILYERTDAEHHLTTNELLDILENEYSMPTHRTTIPTDVELLQDFGLDIKTIRSSRMQYYLASRDFDNAELKLLIDAVESAKFISKDKSENLSDKIARLAGNMTAPKLKRNVTVERRIKTDNELSLNVIDAINEAINQGKKISFKYFQYNVKKERKEKHNGEVYIISPYKLVWNGEFYYVVAHSDKHGDIGSFRIDRIATVPEILAENATPLPKNFDMDYHLNTMYHMFSTKRETVTLICKNELMDAMIDRFGEDVTTYAYDMENFKLEADVAVNKLFYMWVFGFEGKVKIRSPKNVKAGYEEMIKKAFESTEDER